MARPMEEIEFVPADTARVEAEMTRLAGARSGWINLLPGVDADDPDAGDEPHRPSPVSALFGPAQSPVTMVTWVPPSGGRRPRDMVKVGIMHPRGRHAVAQLKDRGLTVPGGWQVRQDHARRGLIVEVASGVPHSQVLEWAIRAGELLAAAPLTGSWQARVYQPSSR
ncbi:MAG: hypothetical protein ACYDHU_00090 [Acidimicrobiales bacterium]